MANSVSVLDRVSVAATYFDAPNTENAWTKSAFGESYNSARCFGKCVRIRGQCASVLWDIDNKLAQIQTHLLRVENEHDDAQPIDTSVVKKAITMCLPQNVIQIVLLT